MKWMDQKRESKGVRAKGTGGGRSSRDTEPTEDTATAPKVECPAKEKRHCYSSSFAPERMRKMTRRKCKRLEPIKRKVWYYLVWWNERISGEQCKLLASELTVVVEHIDRKCKQIDDDIKLTMFEQR